MINGRFASVVRCIVVAVVAAAAALAPAAQPPTQTGPARPDIRIRASIACLLAADYVDPASAAVRQPARLYDVDVLTGSATAPRLTAAAGLLGLAWGPDGALYGLSAHFATGSFAANSLYRINPSTGATTLIGPTGIGYLTTSPGSFGVGHGDLATNPLTGELFAANLVGFGQSVWRFPGITTTTQNATAQLLGVVQHPVSGVGWDILGLAFDSAGNLYILGQPYTSTGNAELRRVNLQPVSGATNVLASTPVVTLPRRFSYVGGLEFVGNRLFFADGQSVNEIVTSSNNLYNLYEIDLTTGAVATIGSTGIPGGVSSLVGCTPPPSCLQPPPDLVAWYPMDGGTADLILGRNVTGGGQINFVPGRVGQAIFMHGGFMQVPDGPVLDQGVGDFSIDAWIRGPATAGTQPLIDKRANVGSGIRGWSLFLSADHLGLQLADGGYDNYIDPRTLGSGWRHVAVTVDRDNPQGVRFYIDGQPGPPFNPANRQGNLDNNAPTFLGRHALNGTVISGLQLDELEFFDRVLAPAEVAAMFNAGPLGKCKPVP